MVDFNTSEGLSAMLNQLITSAASMLAEKGVIPPMYAIVQSNSTVVVLPIRDDPVGMAEKAKEVAIEQEAVAVGLIQEGNSDGKRILHVTVENKTARKTVASLIEENSVKERITPSLSVDVSVEPVDIIYNKTLN